MKFTLLFVIVAFYSCHDPNYKVSPGFKQIVPDTSKTWAGRETGKAFIWTRTLQAKFHLDSLEWGTTGKEIRAWHLSGSYDLQVLQIIRQSPNGECFLRVLQFNHSKQDSVQKDIRRRLPSGLLDSATVAQLWALPSQSQMADGDTYGCMDGSDLFIEMATAERYKILWYRCPYINKEKNAVFKIALDVIQYINGHMIVM